MRDLTALIVPIAMYAMGYIVAVDVEAERRAASSSAAAIIAADNLILRQTIKTLQQSCPARPRLSRAPYNPKGLI